MVHCPESNMKLASGFCPVQKLLAAGVNVCLGTDGAASNNDLSMLGEMKTATLLGKAVAKDASAIKGHAPLQMATINGAIAAGIDVQRFFSFFSFFFLFFFSLLLPNIFPSQKITGSLEVGKSADIIAIDFDLLEFQPVFHPSVALIYASQSNQCVSSNSSFPFSAHD